MKKVILLLALSLTATISHAGEFEDAAKSFYTINCGTVKEVLVLNGLEDKLNQVTDADLADLAEMRAPVLNVLTKGAPAIKELIDLGSQQDTGAFGAIMACDALSSMEDLVKKNGCVVDLKTEKRIYDGPGFAACAKLNANLPK